MIKKKIFNFCLFLFPFFVFGSTFEFQGQHLIASYSECNHAALTDLHGLEEAMKEGVVAAGATILNSVSYVFPPNGLTMVILLSESHASIHTYPEYNACFVDLFTCGHKCQLEKFDQVLRSYLQPEQVSKKILQRDSDIEERLCERNINVSGPPGCR